MVIKEAHLQPYRLPFRAPWQSARSRLESRRGWLVRITTGNGYTGYGDCAPLPAAGTETGGTAEGWLRRKLSRLPGASPSAERVALEETAPPAARFAVETALLDLEAQMQGVPLWRLLPGDPAPSLTCNAAAGPLEAGTGARLAKAAADGFGIAKIKVGTGEPRAEVAHLREICRQISADLEIRIDANAAWSEAGARSFLAGLDDLPVEMVEEPLDRPDGEALSRLQASTPCPLALDENLSGVGVDTVAVLRPVRRVVLKPAVWGGIGRAAALARHMRSKGIGCIVTTTLEGPVGTWAAVHLAFAAGSPDLAHGLATASWFDTDPGAFPEIREGTVYRPEPSGLGCPDPLAGQ